MKHFHVALAVLLVVAAGTVASRAQKREPLHSAFNFKPGDLVSTGRNPYFILEPGYTLVLSGIQDGHKSKLVVKVLDATEPIDDVKTRVVEARRTVNDTLAEVSRSYYAISRKTHDVYCFGADVNQFQHGRLVGHPGSWRAGMRSQYGLAMPATPQLGQNYFEEMAPGVAANNAKVDALDAALVTPAGNFTKVLRVQETSSLKPGVTTYKYYAPGIGLVRDGELLLAKMPDAGKRGK